MSSPRCPKCAGPTVEYIPFMGPAEMICADEENCSPRVPVHLTDAARSMRKASTLDTISEVFKKMCRAQNIGIPGPSYTPIPIPPTPTSSKSHVAWPLPSPLKAARQRKKLLLALRSSDISAEEYDTAMNAIDLSGYLPGNSCTFTDGFEIHWYS